MWTLYDELIAAVPEGLVVEDCLLGEHWFLVRSAGVGVAMTPLEIGAPSPRSDSPVGRPVREVAGWVKSWNFVEAAIGLAAINSALNAPSVVERHWGTAPAKLPSEEMFCHVAPQLAGKKVAVVGHFPGLERIAAGCTLSIIERRPGEGDLPDPASEYILDQQDIVIMTATTLINKTMPRLLQLAAKARVMVCGPSTPLTPLLFGHGVELLGGLVVEDPAKAWQVAAGGPERDLLRLGSRMINLTPDLLSAR